MTTYYPAQLLPLGVCLERVVAQQFGWPTSYMAHRLHSNPVKAVAQDGVKVTVILEDGTTVEYAYDQVAYVLSHPAAHES